MEREKRKATLEKTATIKVNVGNYENVEVSQSIKIDVEFESGADLDQKDAALTQRLVALLKKTAEDTLKATNRSRMGGSEPVELW